MLIKWCKCKKEKKTHTIWDLWYLTFFFIHCKFCFVDILKKRKECMCVRKRKRDYVCLVYECKLSVIVIQCFLQMKGANYMIFLTVITILKKLSKCIYKTCVILLFIFSSSCIIFWNLICSTVESNSSEFSGTVILI